MEKRGEKIKNWDYSRLKELVANKELPLMLVDLERFDDNVKRILQVARTSEKKLRPATKSIRVPFLIKRVLELGGDQISGLMCFSCSEAKFLWNEGLDNLLVAYPTVAESCLDKARDIVKAGGKIILMVDDQKQVEMIQSYAKKNGIHFSLCIDVDLSLRLFFGLVHLGVQRSPIRNLEDFARLVDSIVKCENVTLCAVMGYEAQVAGLPDKNPFAPLLNIPKHWIRMISVKSAKKRRTEISNFLKNKNIQIEFFNGGGTGSLDYTSQEEAVSELTAGSGFLQSHLFDYYSEGHSQSAFCFALPIGRMPEEKIVTCKSGGFIASGEIGPDKAPIVFLPEGIETIPMEGLGEVQTPLKIKSNHRFSYNDPIFFRPAKAGEIAERFNSYWILEKGELTRQVPTYRGLGHAFY